MELVYDGKESVTQYLKRAEEFKMKIIKDKYDDVINFLNDFLNLKGDSRYRSLTDFKNISEKKFFKDKKHTIEIITKYENVLKKQFRLDTAIDVKMDKLDQEEINKKIMYIFTKILSSLNFKFRRREFNKNILLTIIGI